MPKVSYRVHDPEIGHTFETHDPHEVSDYVRDDFISNSPVHVETLHDGKRVKFETHDPKQWHGDTFTTGHKGRGFAFRKN